MLKEEVEEYSKLTGEDGWHVPIIKIGAYLDGYHKGLEVFEEQQSCEDCISREAVNTLVDELARAISDERCFLSRGRSTANIIQDILDLPSVTPQSKIGQLIITDDCERFIAAKGLLLNVPNIVE